MITELREAGFYVRYVRPNIIYISWINKEKQNKKINNQKRLVLENILTMKTIDETQKKRDNIRLLEYRKK